ncbi:MAG: nucleotidyltransferase substrate binding protein [Planctomycetaceae bacterium]|jgi:nucleotidyltransferase substrate binding protein (TIGR01987 family)|nr:nucleotidyltransferase substrate binding protein [Planctomycetaceae bacterium]
MNYEKLQKSLIHLQRQFENYRRSDQRKELIELDREALAESVIQRFETCYDTLWKILKRYIVDELGLAEVPNSPKPVFRLANENNLLPSPVEQWLIYADSRTGTAHDYSGTKATECLQIVPQFIDDAIKLYQTLTEELLQ